MAICFELVVNFGDNLAAAHAALAANGRREPLKAGPHRIPLHRPLLHAEGTFIEVSFLPVAVSYGFPLDGTLPHFKLTAQELTELGHELYGLLATFDGYVAAMVGWDPESSVDPAELLADREGDYSDLRIPGLVVSDALHAELGLDADLEEFRPGYRWLPYQGQRPSTLTADPR
jgi:hypothetical protein